MKRMKVIVVDDMISARNMLVRILKDIEGIQVIETFPDAVSALNYLKGNSVDFMFLDIEMPEITGLELAKELEGLEAPPQVAFVTAYGNYALDAWKTCAIGYVLKPFNKEGIKQVIKKYEALKLPAKAIKDKGKENQEDLKENNKVVIMCFPSFDVFIDKKPISFRSKKAKELLAYLVHNKGQWVSVNTLSYILLGDIDETKAQNSLRSYLSRLRKQLKEEGVSYLLQQDYGKCRINTHTFACDYYEYLKGNTKIFNGEYMVQYSWAEAVQEEMKKN